MRNTIKALLCTAVLGVLAQAPAWASYAIYVGKNLTEDGSVFLGGTGDEPSSHWLEIVPRKDHSPGERVYVGVEKEARFPGELIPIPQVAVTARYITMNYSEYRGLPSPLTNGGLNEYGVAALDVWSTSSEELRRMTPRPQHGPNYSDLARIVMERARTAREAVEIAGALIEKYGDSTYGGNSHFFADANEGWVMIEFAGGKGLWIAERVGPDEIRMAHPGYVGPIPLDFQKHPDRYLGSANFISFAVEQGWYDPHAGKPFDVNVVYQGGREGRLAEKSLAIIEDRLRQRAKAGKISFREFLDTIRDPLLSADWSGYGQAVRLRSGLTRPDLNMVWLAPTGSVTAPFIPYWIGVERVPPEYGKHRYLSHRESEWVVNKDFQIQEASQFAFRTFKRLMYYTCDKPAKFLPEVTEALTAFENESISQSASVQARAAKLFEVGENAMARDTLTEYSNQRAMDGLRLGESLLASIEARHRLLYGYRPPELSDMSGGIHGNEDPAQVVMCLTK
jgi:dipeptidase